MTVDGYLERGEYSPSLALALRLAAALQASVEQIFSFEPEFNDEDSHDQDVRDPNTPDQHNNETA